MARESDRLKELARRGEVTRHRRAVSGSGSKSASAGRKTVSRKRGKSVAGSAVAVGSKRADGGRPFKTFRLKKGMSIEKAAKSVS